MTAELQERIRKSLEGDPNISEVRMFGGVCFMLNGNMLVCSMRDGSMLARLGGDQMPAALKKDGVAQMVMSGRQMKDFVVIHGDELSDAATEAMDRAGDELCWADAGEGTEAEEKENKSG
jgi:hypothetical protein